jgi:hypothetical protein
MLKNVSGQKIVVFAFDATTGLPKSGDAANITAYVSKDWGAVTVLGDTSATEMDATNAKGLYLFDLTQAETNANTLIFSGKSSTANIVVVGRVETTVPANFQATSIDSSGNVAANITQRLGVAELPRYTGTALGGSTTTIQLAAGTTALQCIPGDNVRLTGGTGAGQVGVVTDFNVATGVATIFGGWPVANPSTGTAYEILKTGGGVPATPADIWSDTNAPSRLTTEPKSPSGKLQVSIKEINDQDIGSSKPYNVAI